MLTDPAADAVLGESRSRVFDLLRSAGRQLGVQEIAQRTGLHPNTARFHLDGLVDAGMAERATARGGQPGRPRVVYQAKPAASGAGRRSYRLLAEILTTLVADHVPGPQRAATEAGRAWGGYLTERPAPSEHLDTTQAVERLTGVLAEIGFDPELESADLRTDETGARIRLRRCPFREVAERHQDVVCALHLGLMHGALAELRTPVTTDRLDPFVEPDLCIAHLAIPGGPSTSEHRYGRS